MPLSFPRQEPRPVLRAPPVPAAFAGFCRSSSGISAQPSPGEQPAPGEKIPLKVVLDIEIPNSLLKHSSVQIGSHTVYLRKASLGGPGG